MRLKALELITAVLLVLVTGIFWGTWFSLSRTMDSLSAELFIRIGKEIMQNVAATMRIIMPASILGLALLIIGSRKYKSVYFYCMLLALILFVATLLVTLMVEVPIDNQIKTWTADNLPENWSQIRDRWQRFHTLRTFLSLTCMVFFVTGILNKKQLRQ